MSLKISVIIGSIRPNRFGDKPARWIMEELKKQKGVEAELLDLREWKLPLFDDPVSPSMNQGKYANETVGRWAQKIAAADAYIMVTPEYNRGPSAALKDALDHVYSEWNNKAVAFIGYGSVGGARAVEQLRLNCIELQMAPIRQAVHIPGHVLFPIVMGEAEWNAETQAGLQDAADKMITQLLWWTEALKAAREKKA